MTLEVTVRHVEPRPVLSITRHVKVDQLDRQIRDDLATLYDVAKERGVAVAGPPLGLYHDPINHEDDGPIEICVPVERLVDVSGDVQAKELPGGQSAAVDLRGDQCDFPAVLQVYDAVYDWIRKNGYEADGSPREIWHSPPGEAAHMEIAFLFRTREG